jgi:hypothetical protein
VILGTFSGPTAKYLPFGYSNSESTALPEQKFRTNIKKDTFIDKYVKCITPPDQIFEVVNNVVAEVSLEY